MASHAYKSTVYYKKDNTDEDFLYFKLWYARHVLLGEAENWRWRIDILTRASYYYYMVSNFGNIAKTVSPTLDIINF